MENKLKIEISVSTIIKFFLILIGIVLLYYVRSVILLLFIVLIIVAALDPFVTRANELWKIPRYATSLFLYLLLLALLILCVYILIPPFVMQMNELQNNFPSYISAATPYIQSLINHVTDWQKILTTVSQSLGSITGGVVDVTVRIFGGIASAVTILIISFYLLIERPEAEKYIVGLIPSKNRVFGIKIFEETSYKIGRWLRGQLSLCFIMGTLTAIIAGFAGIPYALVLGLIAFLLEVVPVVGVFIVGVLVVSSALYFGGWITALVVLAVFLGMHELESSVLIPKIMGKAVNLSPVTILIALLIGGTLAGISGAILSIPGVAALAVVFQEWRKVKQIESK